MIGEALGIPFFKTMARIDERLMMSFQGKRAEDVVTAMVGLETMEHLKQGVQPLPKKPGMKDPNAQQ